MHTGHHVNAGSHHGCCVDQRGDRCGAFHSIGQPDIERNLRALAGGAEKQAQSNDRQHATLPGRVHCEVGADLAEGQGAEVTQQQEHGNEEAEVTDTVDDEGLLACIRGGLALKIEADKQVGREAHTFPTDEHQQGIAGEHQNRHEEQEEVQVREIAPVAVFMRHVTGGVNVDQESDTCDDQQHDQ